MDNMHVSQPGSVKSPQGTFFKLAKSLLSSVLKGINGLISHVPIKNRAETNANQGNQSPIVTAELGFVSTIESSPHLSQSASPPHNNSPSPSPSDLSEAPTYHSGSGSERGSQVISESEASKETSLQGEGSASQSIRERARSETVNNNLNTMVQIRLFGGFQHKEDIVESDSETLPPPATTPATTLGMPADDPLRGNKYGEDGSMRVGNMPPGLQNLLDRDNKGHMAPPPNLSGAGLRGRNMRPSERRSTDPQFKSLTDEQKTAFIGKFDAALKNSSEVSSSGQMLNPRRVKIDLQFKIAQLNIPEELKDMIKSKIVDTITTDTVHTNVVRNLWNMNTDNLGALINQTLKEVG